MNDYERLSALFLKDRVAIAQKNLLLLGRCPYYQQKQDFGAIRNINQVGINFDDQSFKIFYDKSPEYKGFFDAIGTYDTEKGTWLWAWHNTSTPDAAYAAVKQFCETTPELEPLVAMRKIEVDRSFIHAMCGWIVNKMDRNSLFAHQYHNSPFIYLAVRDLEPIDQSSYCCMCMSTATEGESELKNFSSRLGICASCQNYVNDILAFEEDGFSVNSEKGSGDDPIVNPSTLFCISCGSFGVRLIAGPHAQICFSCVQNGQ